MNKKVMAIAMAAVMLMVAVTVGVSVQSDADPTPVSVSGGSKYIVGANGTPYTIYTDQTNGINATIEFNEAAFSNSRNVSFTINGENAALGVSKDLVDDSKTTVSVVITKDGASNNKDGKYTVNFIGKNAISAKTITIVMTVQDYVCSNKNHSTEQNHTEGGCISLPKQTFTFLAYINVENNSGDIYLGGFEPEDADEGSSTLRYFDLTFNFETTYDITAFFNTTNNVESAKAGYKFYATGLPIGISMNTDGHIGGKIAGTYTTGSSDTGTIYAVSPTGTVHSVAVKWTIGNRSTEGANYNVTATVTSGGNTVAYENVQGSYVVMTTGDKLAVSSAGIDGSVIISQKVTFNNQVIQNSPFEFTPNGTGTFKVTVTADVKKPTDSRGFVVEKSFTVYVVGKIVDADLDPSVKST